MLHPCRFQTLLVPSALDGYNGCRVNVNIIFFNLVAELTVVLRHHKQCGAACDLIARLYLAFPFVAVNGHVTVAVVNHYPVAVYHNGLNQAENWDVRYIVPAMLKLIQDQKKMLDAQQAQINELTARIDALEGK